MVQYRLKAGILGLIFGLARYWPQYYLFEVIVGIIRYIIKYSIVAVVLGALLGGPRWVPPPGGSTNNNIIPGSFPLTRARTAVATLLSSSTPNSQSSLTQLTSIGLADSSVRPSHLLLRGHSESHLTAIIYTKPVCGLFFPAINLDCYSLRTITART